MKSPKNFQPRKLLVAAVGIASVNYLLACHDPQPPTPVGNLAMPLPLPDAAPPPPDAAGIPPTGNLPAPMPAGDAGAPTTRLRPPPSVGNLAFPHPRDGGSKP